jgi:hypothetical protein
MSTTANDIFGHAQFLIVLVPHLGHGLTKVHGDTPVVDQHIIHFQVRFGRLLLRRKFTKGVLQRLSGTSVANNLHFDRWIKSRKYQFQILVDRDGIEFTAKQDRVGRGNLHFGTWQVAEHFEDRGAAVIFLA